MDKRHVKTPKNQWFEIVQPLRFPVKNSFFRGPRPGIISLLKRQWLGDEICFFGMEKGVVCLVTIGWNRVQKKIRQKPMFSI